MATQGDENKAHGVRSVGVIMDGNRRWARQKGLPTLEGHRQGLEKAKELVRWAVAAGVQEITLYIFSTENWERSKDEVSYLMTLFEKSFDTLVTDAVESSMRVRFIGQRERASELLQRKMQEAEARTAGGDKGTLVLAFSYGGRAEILAGVNALIARGVANVDEPMLRDALWSRGLADPDLLIRTGGEKRLSNFLTWQSVYSELFFSEALWPDFTKEEFDGMLAEFAARERRHGK